jgi:hypothetical protein
MGVECAVASVGSTDNTEPVIAGIKIYICHHKKPRCAASMSYNRYKKIINIYTLATLLYGTLGSKDISLCWGQVELRSI